MVERWESVVCMLTCFQCILSDAHSTTATRNSLTALRRLSSPVSYMRPAAHFVRRVHAAAPTRTRCATRQAGTRRREEHSQRRASHNLCSFLHRTRCRAGDGSTNHNQRCGGLLTGADRFLRSCLRSSLLAKCSSSLCALATTTMAPPPGATATRASARGQRTSALQGLSLHQVEVHQVRAQSC